MASHNSITVIGHVGKQPELRSFQNGGRMASFSVATTDTWKKDGEKQSQTQWHNIVVTNENLISVIEKFVVKGSLVYICGKMEYRKFTDKSGNERTSAEITLRPFKGEIQILDKQKPELEPVYTPTEPTPKPDFEDEIPF